MAYDTNLLLIVESSRLGGKYEVHRFLEYKIDIDLETDADGFDFVLTNPNSGYTGLFSKFDKVEIKLNNKPIMRGRVDNVKYITNETSNSIQLSGRDIAAALVDNDALPGTRLNVKPSAYIKEKCTEYGITNIKAIDVPVVNKLIIGTGESEISIMNNLLMEDRKRMWLIYDTIYIGEWSTNIKPSYYFTRGLPLDKSGIPIKTLSLSEDGTNTKSEIRIYGSMNSGSEKVVGIAKNDWMINKGIKKRMTRRSSNNDSSSKYASKALKDIRDGFKENIVVELTIKTGKDIIMPNTTAHVIDSVTKINSVFFIKSVSYSKDIRNGSITTVTMIPGDSAFEVLWTGQGTQTNGGITGTPKLSLSELIKSKKG